MAMGAEDTKAGETEPKGSQWWSRRCGPALKEITMPTGTVRVELHPPGTTPEHRGPAPLASATLTLNGTTPTDPAALPTVASLVSGGLSGPCVALITPSVGIQDAFYCATGKTPDVTKEPRHFLSGDNTGRLRTFVVEIGNNDRIQLAGVA